MYSNFDYRKCIVTKSSPVIVERDIISSGLLKLSNFSTFVKSPQIVFDDYKVFQLVKNPISCNLGPGRYPTPPPNPGPSFKFGFSKRFNEVLRPSSSSKSTDKIKANKKLDKHIPLNKSTTEIQKFKATRTKEKINRLTKTYIETEKNIKMRKQIDEKLFRIEIRKHKTIRDSITKTYVSLLISCMIPFGLNKKFAKIRDYKRKINHYKSLLRIACKFIAKFRRLKRKAVISISWKILVKFMPKLLRKKKQEIQNNFITIVMNTVDRFLKSCSIPRLNLLIRQKVLLIQKSIRAYLLINQARKYAIQLMWGRLDRKQIVTANVKGYYIWRYLNEKIREFAFLKKKYYPNFFFTSQSHENIIANILKTVKENRDVVLKIYSKTNLKKVIEEAYRLPPGWSSTISEKYIIEELSSIPEGKGQKKVAFPEHKRSKKKKTLIQVSSAHVKPRRKSIRVKFTLPTTQNN